MRVARRIGELKTFCYIDGMRYIQTLFSAMASKRSEALIVCMEHQGLSIGILYSFIDRCMAIGSELLGLGL